MSEVQEVLLTGCTPEPLMSYLKALGMLRLICEQVDPDAAGCWRNDCFVLRSKFDREQLSSYFLNDYCPTPIIGPWAGGSGFFGNDNQSDIEAILNSTVDRFTAFRDVIERTRGILNEQRVFEKPADEVKEMLLRLYRRTMPDQFVEWMDAAMVLQSQGQAFAPFLGTGGNDGRLDFTQNFMKRLVELKLHEAKPASKAKALLRNALFAQAVSGLGKAAVGQFAPGRAGGPNATQGMEGNPTDNLWDLVLMLEGALMLAGSVTRRIGVHSTDKAAFPFTVRARPVGGGSSSEDELASSRGELWLPIWDDFASHSELQTLFSEGRADVSGRPAREALDFARAVAGLGIDRGIRSFTRFGFLKRSGKAYLATAMNRFQVPRQPREATDLLQRLDGWLNAYRRACSARETPTRLKTPLSRIESAIFDYCGYGRREDLQSVLIALGRAERELAMTGGHRGGKEICRPLSGLSTAWLKATHDRTPEFDIALALAGMYDAENKVPPLRSNIEPVAFETGRWQWQESGPHVVWKSADLATNMAAVLLRRMMDGARAGCEELPLHFHRTVSLDTVAAFIAGDLDDRRIDDLLWGLMLIDHRQQYPKDLPRAKVDDAAPLPREYALLKLLFLPRPLIREWDQERQRANWRSARRDEGGIEIPAEPRILPLLRAGRLDDACRIAYQRLRSSGLSPLPAATATGVWRAKDWQDDPSVDARRVAAALLSPVSEWSVNRLVHLVTRQDEEPDSADLVSEGTAAS